MLIKIKGMMKIKEAIDEVNSKLETTASELGGVKKEIKQLTEETTILKNNQKDLFLDFKENIGLMKDIREDFEKETYNFKLLQNHLQSRILEKFENEIRDNLVKEFEKLKTDVSNFNRLKNKVDDVGAYAEELSEEINKLIQISKKIKKEDFELNKFASKILEADEEKLKLMREIDTLQRLISKMRKER